MTKIPKRKSNRYNIIKMTDYTLEEKEPSNDEILEKAYNNAWLLFSETKTFTDISLTPYMSESYMPFDPYNLMNKDEFEATKLSILEWFSDSEEYEKCAFIRDYKYKSYVKLMKPFTID